jgi:DNA-binding GntR family transcriptional regulator
MPRACSPRAVLSEQDAASFGNGSLYELLCQHGTSPVGCEQSARAALPSTEEAALLNLEPVFEMRTIAVIAEHSHKLAGEILAR